MDEITCKVYDVFYPSPLSLKELSAINISTEMWRYEVNEYRRSHRMETFDPYLIHPSLETIIPNLPPVIYQTIEKYVAPFGDSLAYWLKQHYTRVFCYNYDNEKHVLEHFDDFVADFEGEIDYTRTAERMMRCNQFSADNKFAIACTYFFEDAIRQIWPSVRKMMHLEDVSFSDNAQVFFWICQLRNELDKIPTRSNETVDEKMFDNWMNCNSPSLIYFWNRIPSEDRARKAASFYNSDQEAFIKFILPKLQGEELREFVNEQFDVYTLLEDELLDLEVILRAWMCIRDEIGVYTFTNLVEKMLKMELCDIDMLDCGRGRVHWVYLMCEIWKKAPHYLKRSSAADILLNRSFFSRSDNDVYIMCCYPKDVELLLNILPYANFEQRNAFWRNRWHQLISCSRSADLNRVMEQCFENENEIMEFKQNVMAISARVSYLRKVLLVEGYFDHLDSLVSFLWPETQAARNVKQQLLRSAFLGRNCRLSTNIVYQAEIFSEFINNAFGSAELSVEFRNQFTSSPEVRRIVLLKCRTKYVNNWKEIKEFICTFFSTEQALQQIKVLVIAVVNEYVNSNDKSIPTEFNQDYFIPYLLWLFGSDERVAEFKRMLSH